GQLHGSVACAEPAPEATAKVRLVVLPASDDDHEVVWVLGGGGGGRGGGALARACRALAAFARPVATWLAPWTGSTPVVNAASIWVPEGAGEVEARRPAMPATARAAIDVPPA